MIKGIGAAVVAVQEIARWSGGWPIKEQPMTNTERARGAMEAKFALRIASEEQRNAYEVGYFDALSTIPNVDELVEALEDLEKRATATLSAVDRYNEKNGTYIIGPSLLQLGKSIAKIDALLSPNRSGGGDA
jgi:hypothetical protein